MESTRWSILQKFPSSFICGLDPDLIRDRLDEGLLQLAVLILHLGPHVYGHVAEIPCKWCIIKHFILLTAQES